MSKEVLASIAARDVERTPRSTRRGTLMAPPPPEVDQLRRQLDMLATRIMATRAALDSIAVSMVETLAELERAYGRRP